jgi:hypothetical protein
MSEIAAIDKKIINDEDNYYSNINAVIAMQEKNKEEANIQFWTQNPNVLFKQQYIFEFFPTENMSYSQKLNAVSRMVIFLTIITFMFTKSKALLFISAITLFCIFMLFHYQEQEKLKLDNKKLNLEKTVENFDNIALDTLKENNISKNTKVFSPPSSLNPFSNVLISDYDYNVNKKPAAPAFNTNVNNDILSQAKQFVREANPDQPDISDKLFKDLGEQYVFEQSLRPFHSNPSTTIPNDQQGFAEFCYGSMVSCKEGNMFACARNLARYTN